MKEYFNLKLKQIWLLISAFSLIIPIFMPSSANPQHFFENVLGTVTVTLFILSFPSSLLGLPFLMFAKALLNINPNSIEALYLNLFLLFALGLAQWFWVVPKLLGSDAPFQTLNLPHGKPEMSFSEVKLTNPAQSYDSEGKTPLERVIQEKDF